MKTLLGGERCPCSTEGCTRIRCGPLLWQLEIRSQVSSSLFLDATNMMFTNDILFLGLVEHGLMLNRSDIMKLRDVGGEQYLKFMMKMGPAMVSHQKWKSSMLVPSGKKHYFSSVVTVSDEAFCIFAIENSWVRWMTKEDMIDKEDPDYSWEFTAEEVEEKENVIAKREERPGDRVWRKRQLVANKYSREERKK